MKIIRTLIILTLFINIAVMTASAANKYVNMTLKYDGSSHNYIAEEVFLNVNGQSLNELTMPPVILNDYTLVPAREVFEKVGAVVSWNSDREEVYVAKGNNLLVLKINSTEAYYNNKTVKMEIPAKLINSKTMIPVRFVSETMGYNVGWDKPTRTVLISEDEIITHAEETTETAVQTPVQTTQAPQVQAQPVQEDYNVITISKDSSALPSDLIPLSDADFGECRITELLASAENNYLRIKADSEIGSVEKGSVSDGRVYFDIYNAKSSLGRVKASYPLPVFSEVRVGERNENGKNITRIAIDTKDSSMQCKLSSDRRSIYIYFPTAVIKDYKLVSNASDDTFTVTGEALAVPNVQKADKTLTVTFANTRLDAAEQTLKRNGYLTDTADISYSGNNTVITFKLKDEAEYKTDVSSSKVSVVIYDKGYKNISANVQNDTLTLKKNGAKINISSILTVDDFENKKYTISLPGNYTSVFGIGEIPFDGSERISSVNVAYEDGNTVLVFNEKTLCEFDITEDSSNIYIKCVNIHDVYDKILVIDAGHGGSDQGAAGNGLIEKNLTLDIVLKLKALFDRNSSFKVYYTRTGDTYPTRAERAALSNFVDCPFVSVHINSVAGNTEANGIEVYWQYENTDENGLTSKALADAIYDKLIEYTGATERGVKTADYQVLRESKNPATLIEVGFITNPAEAAKMGSDSYQSLVAQAIYDALNEIM